MTSARQLYQQLIRQINVYPPKETQAIAFMLLEHYMHLRNVDVLVDRPISDSQIQPDWNEIVERLNHNEPIQHIIGSTEFCGLTFQVSASVLIPRPETEELVRLVTRDYAEPDEKPSILDIGTGSGCIAIVLARFLPHANVHAWDVSDDALSVARENARQLMADVHFEKQDMLHVSFPLPGAPLQFDCIVSNPPYVTYSEADQMRPNVLRFEPHEALFVEDNDPLLFYKAIADFGRHHLKANGRCYVEINEHFGPETRRVFEERGYQQVEILLDIHGKNRFIRAARG
jgi:release factor glutamine methyltransferase